MSPDDEDEDVIELNATLDNDDNVSHGERSPKAHKDAHIKRRKSVQARCGRIKLSHTKNSALGNVLQVFLASFRRLGNNVLPIHEQHH